MHGIKPDDSAPRGEPFAVELFHSPRWDVVSTPFSNVTVSSGFEFKEQLVDSGAKSKISCAASMLTPYVQVVASSAVLQGLRDYSR